MENVSDEDVADGEPVFAQAAFVKSCEYWSKFHNPRCKVGRLIAVVCAAWLPVTSLQLMLSILNAVPAEIALKSINTLSDGRYCTNVPTLEIVAPT